MKRPYLVHSTILMLTDSLSLRLQLGLSTVNQEFHPERSTPWYQIKNFFKRNYQIKIVGNDIKDRPLWTRFYDSDEFGEFFIKIPLLTPEEHPHSITLYEVGYTPLEEWLLGCITPIKLPAPCNLKLLISDFDKTLVETKFAKASDFFKAMTRSVSRYPNLERSLDHFRHYCNDGFIPFIVSASPHFFAQTIQNWARKQKLPPIQIFLKDYRKIFSLFSEKLASKDLRKHGHYKLGELITILLLTSIPSELTLMGDDSESDPLIYLSLTAILKSQTSPAIIWEQLKTLPDFGFTSEQDTLFLNKIYQLRTHLERQTTESPKITLLIRTLHEIPREFTFPPFLQKWVPLLQFYYDSKQ